MFFRNYYVGQQWGHPLLCLKPGLAWTVLFCLFNLADSKFTILVARDSEFPGITFHDPGIITTAFQINHLFTGEISTTNGSLHFPMRHISGIHPGRNRKKND